MFCQVAFLIALVLFVTEQDGNIERAAYVTLKIDGFPYDEVYEVKFLILDCRYYEARSSIAPLPVISIQDVYNFLTALDSLIAGLAPAGVEPRHGKNGASIKDSFLPHKVLSTRPTRHMHILRRHIAASISSSSSECLLS